MSREDVQNLYIRTCRDSGWLLEHVEAAKLVARVAGIHPMDVWGAMGTLQTMRQVAAGEHPACHREGQS